MLTPGNARRLAERLSTMRGAVMKVGQLMSMDGKGVLRRPLPNCWAARASVPAHAGYPAGRGAGARMRRRTTCCSCSASSSAPSCCVHACRRGWMSARSSAAICSAGYRVPCAGSAQRCANEAARGGHQAQPPAQAQPRLQPVRRIDTPVDWHNKAAASPRGSTGRGGVAAAALPRPPATAPRPTGTAAVCRRESRCPSGCHRERRRSPPHRPKARWRRGAAIRGPAARQRGAGDERNQSAVAEPQRDRHGGGRRQSTRVVHRLTLPSQWPPSARRKTR